MLLDLAKHVTAGDRSTYRRHGRLGNLGRKNKQQKQQKCSHVTALPIRSPCTLALYLNSILCLPPSKTTGDYTVRLLPPTTSSGFASYASPRPFTWWPDAPSYSISFRQTKNSKIRDYVRLGKNYNRQVHPLPTEEGLDVCGNSSVFP